MDWIHRPGDSGATDPGSLNLCFNALDRHVVRGLADETALRVVRITAGSTEHTFARLLEEVAAFGGVLRAFDVRPGERVVSRLPMGLAGLVTALAAARIGAVHVGLDRYADPAGPLAAHRPAVVVADGSDAAMASALADAPTELPRATIWHGTPPSSLAEGQDLEWEVMLRAGRTDPAPVVELAATSPAFVVGDRVLSVAEAAAGETGEWPLDAIATLVSGDLLMLSLP